MWHMYNNKDPSRLRWLSRGMRVNTRYINSILKLSFSFLFFFLFKKTKQNKKRRLKVTKTRRWVLPFCAQQSVSVTSWTLPARGAKVLKAPHEPVLFCSSSGKSEPAWLLPWELRFERKRKRKKKEKNFCCRTPNEAYSWRYFQFSMFFQGNWSFCFASPLNACPSTNVTSGHNSSNRTVTTSFTGHDIHVSPGYMGNEVERIKKTKPTEIILLP